MRKFVIMIAAILILGVAAVTFMNGSDVKFPIKETEEAALNDDTVEKNVSEEADGVDYEALRNAYPADTVVATVNGKDITWDTMYSWLCFHISQMEYTMQQYAYYGQTVTWDNVIDEETGRTLADDALNSAGDYIKQIASVLDYAEQINCITEESEQMVQDAVNEGMTSIVGDSSNDAAFDEYLAGVKMTRKQFEDINRFNVYYGVIFTSLYNEDASKITDEQAMSYLEDNGFIAANHILFLTTNMETGEEYTAEQVEEAYNNAVALANELQAIEDHDELVKRFLELKEEYDQDSGKVRYPNGYTFTEGEMVESFYEAAKNAEEYEVTNPVQSPYGYHIIIRLPLDPDAGLTSQQNASARQIVAETEFSEIMNQNYLSTEVVLSDIVNEFTLADYIK